MISNQKVLDVPVMNLFLRRWKTAIEINVSETNDNKVQKNNAGEGAIISML
jgi:hypothetical protein